MVCFLSGEERFVARFFRFRLFCFEKNEFAFSSITKSTTLQFSPADWNSENGETNDFLFVLRISLSKKKFSTNYTYFWSIKVRITNFERVFWLKKSTQKTVPLFGLFLLVHIQQTWNISICVLLRKRCSFFLYCLGVQSCCLK